MRFTIAVCVAVAVSGCVQKRTPTNSASKSESPARLTPEKRGELRTALDGFKATGLVTGESGKYLQVNPDKWNKETFEMKTGIANIFSMLYFDSEKLPEGESIFIQDNKTGKTIGRLGKFGLKVY